MKSARHLDLPHTSTAVVTIDIQLDYFGGYRYPPRNGAGPYRSAFPLFRARSALARTVALLDWARERHLPILHVRHESTRPGSTFLNAGTPGTELHPALAVRPGEAIVPKNFPNSFRGTELEPRLRGLGVTTVVWAGMISWMCVDTTVRAAWDLGFSNVLISDATASGPLMKVDGLTRAASGGRIGMPIAPWTLQRDFVAGLAALHARVLPLRAFLEAVSLS